MASDEKERSYQFNPGFVTMVDLSVDSMLTKKENEYAFLIS
jgi:hypothetical protein